jgi:ABC-2 type transport system ATP-binding protein
VSKTPPNEEPAVGSSFAEPSSEAALAERPRTVARRTPRPLGRPVTAPATADPSTGSEQATEAPVVAETSVRDEPAAPDEPSPVSEIDRDEINLESVDRDHDDHEDNDDVDRVNVQASAPNEVRAVRVEVPVPSVARARERATRAIENPVVLRAESLTKSYGQLLAAADISFDVHAGSLTGVVGPNGAGKTTVLSMISGLNRPTSGRISVRDIDVWRDGPAAKRVIGSLPDRLRLFDRLTGGQLLYYAGVLQGLDQKTVAQRATELAQAFALESALDRPVSDYSAGMQKKIGLACSMIHSPEVLVLDEPYETIDPVSASNVTEILEKYVAGGGSVIMSSHSLDLIQRICDHVVVIVDGSIVAQGTLEERFTHLSRDQDEGKGLEWLHGSSGSD